MLNAVTTISMVRLGKVYGNLMVDRRCSNVKLWDRGARIVSMVTGLERDAAMAVLKEAGGWVKAAIVMQKRRRWPRGGAGHAIPSNRTADRFAGRSVNSIRLDWMISICFGRRDHDLRGGLERRQLAGDANALADEAIARIRQTFLPAFVEFVPRNAAA